MANSGGSAAIPLSRLGVLVAQLESIAASARQQPPDPLLCFDLLSELVSAIDEEPKARVFNISLSCMLFFYRLLISEGLIFLFIYNVCIDVYVESGCALPEEV